MCHCFPDVMLCLALQQESKGGKAYEFFAVLLCKRTTNVCLIYLYCYRPCMKSHGCFLFIFYVVMSALTWQLNGVVYLLFSFF